MVSSNSVQSLPGAVRTAHRHDGENEKIRLQYQDLPYNKAFWDHYNVIKTAPLDKKVIEDIEKELPLEKQFEE